MITKTFNIYSIEKDGMPDKSKLSGRLAFINDGDLIMGWPLYQFYKDDGRSSETYGKDEWEGSEGGHFYGIKHYVIFEEAFYNMNLE